MALSLKKQLRKYKFWGSFQLTCTMSACIFWQNALNLCLIFLSCVVAGIDKCQGALGERSEDLGRQRVSGLPGQSGVHRQRGRRPGTGVRFPVEALWCRVRKHACRYTDTPSWLCSDKGCPLFECVWYLHKVIFTYTHTFHTQTLLNWSTHLFLLYAFILTLGLHVC